jgi:hypothetical protein
MDVLDGKNKSLLARHLTAARLEWAPPWVRLDETA